MKEKQAQAAIIIGSILILALLLLNGCKQIQVVTEYRDHFVHDTTEVVDSFYIDQVHYLTQKGDTIFKTDSVFVYKYRTLEKVVIEEVNDSIPYPVEVVKEVRKTSGFARFCIAFFFLVLIGVLGFAGWRIYRRFFLHL